MNPLRFLPILALITAMSFPCTPSALAQVADPEISCEPMPRCITELKRYAPDDDWQTIGRRAREQERANIKRQARELKRREAERRAALRCQTPATSMARAVPRCGKGR